MSPRLDETTLSAFVDGQLDADEMRDVEALVEVDLNARQYVWQAFKTQAHLRAALNPVAEEKIPARLINAFDRTPAAAKPKRHDSSTRRPASPDR